MTWTRPSRHRSVTTVREYPGEETAAERFARLKAAGQPTGWAGFCTVPNYCTRPCTQCEAEGERSQGDGPRGTE